MADKTNIKEIEDKTIKCFIEVFIFPEKEKLSI
jgi:hypothetical protein